MNEIQKLRRIAGHTQESLARSAGTSQPTIAQYERGRKSPTLATLHRLAKSVGLKMWVDFYPAMTREERRSLFLHRAIARRLANDPEGIRERARETLGLMMAKHRGPPQLLLEWEVLIERQLPDLVALLSDPSPHARELRHVTPFAGILSAPERADTYQAFADQERAA